MFSGGGPTVPSYRSKMKRILAIILSLVTGLSHGLCAGGVGRSEIRGFDIAALERLGRELYRRDALAANATDLLFERYPDARQMSSAGWITELNEKVSRVYFLLRTDQGLRLGYIAIFPVGQVPTIEAHMNEPVPKPIMLRHLARTTAIAATSRHRSDRPHNFEVLDDPDGDGFLVYSLAASSDPNEVVVGGHTRVSISRDGKVAERVDALSRSLLILDKRKAPAGGEVEGFVVTHIVSGTPIETHVFLSLMHMIPLHVVTGEKSFWKVDNGRILKLEIPAAPGAAAKRTERRGE